MRQARRTLACLLACVLAVTAALGTLARPSNARADETTPYKITVTNPSNGITYSAYKVMDVVYASDKSSYAYGIKNTDPFYNAVADCGLFVLEQVSNDGSTTTFSVTLKDSNTTDLSSLIAAIQARLSSGSTVTPIATKTASSDDATLTLDVSDGPGYYFVSSTMGAICSLDTTSPTVEIQEKNQEPTIEKLVQEKSQNNGDYGYVQKNDAAIGDTVSFRTKITIATGAQNYVLHDTLSAGLTLNADSFKFGTSGDPGQATPEGAVPTAYKNMLDINTVPGNGETFTITFKDDPITIEGESSSTTIHNYFLQNNPSGVLYVFYTATLNENAVVGTAGNPNETTLTYGTDERTDSSSTMTYTWPLSVYKYTGTSTPGTPLAGAEFKLEKADSSWSALTTGVSTENASLSNPLKFTAGAGTTYRLDASGNLSTIATGTTGEITLNGLDSGNYLLTETKAPTGYNQLTQPVRITIGVTVGTGTVLTPTYAITDGDKTSVAGSASLADSTINVQNNTGTEMPSTGGIGTTILYVVGSVLVVGAGAALIARRRGGER